MTILDGHELYSLPTRMSLLRSSLYSINILKIKKVLIFPLSEVIMEENLKMKTFNNYVKNMEFIILFPVQKLLNRMTLYKLWKGRKPNIFYFHNFGCDCFILNTKDSLGKFDPKSDKETFNGYLTTSKAYRVYNSRTYRVRTRSTFKDQSQIALLSEVEPKNIKEALLNDEWILATQEELD
ncbi:hypothetical protein CR513_57690, partial [Mucuna pruriens]